jgi:hypothetical protein
MAEDAAFLDQNDKHLRRKIRERREKPLRNSLNLSE